MHSEFRLAEGIVQLERENRRLTEAARFGRRSKRELGAEILRLEETLAAERRERAAMEEALTAAYSATLRDIVAQQEIATTARAAPAAGARNGARLKDKLSLR